MKMEPGPVLKVIMAFCIIFSCPDSPGTAQDSFPAPEKIIENCYMAANGKDARKKTRNISIEYIYKRRGSEMANSLLYYQERPDRVYFVRDMDKKFKTISGTDGKDTWEESPYQGARITSRAQLANELQEFTFDDPDLWKDLYYEIRTEGIGEVDGRACYKVAFVQKSGDTRINFYDKETFLILKTITEKRTQNNIYNIEIIFKDYKKTDEITFPHRIIKLINGQTIDIKEVLSVKTNIEIPEGTFNTPVKIAEILSKENKAVETDRPVQEIAPLASRQKLSFKVDLSPDKWEPSEVIEYNHLNQLTYRENQIINGENGIIVGTTGPQAQRAGLEALKQGGTAIDAALTASLTNIVLNAGCVVSYAGIMEMVYYDAAADKYYNLNASWNTPLKEDDPLSIPRGSSLNPRAVPAPSGRTALVPGYMAGVEAAHKRFGKLPFSSLFTPAIYYAEKGFQVSGTLSYLISRRQSTLYRLPETKRIFLNKETGYSYNQGEKFYQPELAVTLRAVAEQGASYMYTGEWARRLVALVKRDGGRLTMEDLKNYRVIWSEPLKTSYKNYSIYSPGLPALGGIRIAQTLNVAGEANLSEMGHYSKSPEAFFWLFQINKLKSLPGYPQDYLSIFIKDRDLSPLKMASKAHAKYLWSKMSEGRFFMTDTPVTNSSNHSDAIVAVDRWGNVAALVHTSNTMLWGGTGIFVDGVSISDSAALNQRQCLQAGRGKRLQDPMIPLIVSKNDRPFIALSSIGSSLHEATASVLFNIMDFDMGLKEAIDAPSMQPQKNITRGFDVAQVHAGVLSDELLKGIRELGLEVEFLNPGSNPGSVVGAMIDDNGIRKGVPSPRDNGVALGY